MQDLVRPPYAIELARRSLQDPLVLLSGPTGTGKSVLAAAMVRGTPGVAWVSWPTFQSVWPETIVAERDRLMRAPVLVLDDLGLAIGARPVEEKAEHEAMEEPEGTPLGDMLELVLASRVASGLRTIVTAIGTQAELARRYSIIVARWLFGGRVIELDPNFRWQDQPPYPDIE